MQTDVPAHAKLGWIMTCLSGYGELQRMTQFKDKMAKQETGITAGLYAYPALMAADILLYDPDYVPVGVDQSQHVELTRDLAERFNHRYSDTFKLPQPLVTKVGAKIYDLQNPTKKMSKSETNPKGVIDLLDDPAVARNKIKAAVTDSLGVVRFDPENQPGVSNLLTILSALTSEDIDSIVARYEGKGYGELKKEVGDVVYDFLTNLQARYKEIIDSGVIYDVLKDGASKANQIAEKKVRKVYKKLVLQSNFRRVYQNKDSFLFNHLEISYTANPLLQLRNAGFRSFLFCSELLVIHCKLFSISYPNLHFCFIWVDSNFYRWYLSTIKTVEAEITAAMPSKRVRAGGIRI